VNAAFHHFTHQYHPFYLECSQHHHCLYAHSMAYRTNTLWFDHSEEWQGISIHLRVCTCWVPCVSPHSVSY